MTLLLLPATFTPGPMDVIISAAGKKGCNHEGNILFRKTIQTQLETYSKASTKMEKSLIISNIVDKIRQDSSPNGGGFIKIDTKSGRWYEIGDHLAREKVSQSFRDLLHLQYQSSAKAKKRRRNEEITKLDNEVGKFVVNTNCKNILNGIKHETPIVGAEADIQRLFNQVNSDFLSVIKDNEERRIKKRRKFEQHSSTCDSEFPIGNFDLEPILLNQAQIHYSSFSSNRPISILSFPTKCTQRID